MKTKYPMLDGGPFFRANDFVVLWRRLIRKAKKMEGNAAMVDVSDNQKDGRFDFDEYPVCESCGEPNSVEVLKAIDGNRIVQCENCGLWFTSPRVNEQKWINWLLEDNERNREFTENRLRYGFALSRNIQLAFSFWWRLLRTRRQKKLRSLFALHGGDVQRIFDVGCGCGYLIKAAQDLGIQASGNDLNRYAVERIRKLFGFDVHVGLLPSLFDKGFVEKSHYDVVYMNDYIEHTYHPKKDLDAAFGMLRPGGLIYISTFCVDSERYKRLGSSWDMLMWNHCFHFSSESLKKLVTDVGFDISMCNVNDDKGSVELVARKP